jgi:hypothetical protein
MYREGLDGFIGVRLLPLDGDNKEQRIEMITILDMLSIYAKKHDLAKKEAMKLLNLQHENLLNLSGVSLEPTHIPDGLLVLKSEAPDHRMSWKTFCKSHFDFE